MNKNEILRAIEGIFSRSNHRCALCFKEGDISLKQGRVVLLGTEEKSLCFICLEHSKSTFQAEEVLKHRDRLEKFFHGVRFWSGPVGGSTDSYMLRSTVSLELYDRRAQIYRKTRNFIENVLALTKIGVQELRQFAESTDETAFLFDAKVAEFVSRVYEEGAGFRRARLYLENCDEWWSQDHKGSLDEIALWSLAEEMINHLNGMVAHLEESWSIFKPYMTPESGDRPQRFDEP